MIREKVLIKIIVCEGRERDALFNEFAEIHCPDNWDILKNSYSACHKDGRVIFWRSYSSYDTKNRITGMKSVISITDYCTRSNYNTVCMRDFEKYVRVNNQRYVHV